MNTLRQQFAYLVQDALGLRQMAHGQDRLLEEFDGDALMVALRRDTDWESRLFGTVLEAELDRRVSLRREIEYRLAQADVTRIELDDVVQWVLDRLSEFDGFGRTALAIVDDYLPQVRGNKGVSGDPIELAAAARRLAQVWDNMARWTLRCRSVRVNPGAQRLVDLLSTTNANMLDEIWEFGHGIIPRLDEAIEEHTGDAPRVVEISLTLTADFDEFNEELDFDEFKKELDRFRRGR